MVQNKWICPTCGIPHDAPPQNYFPNAAQPSEYWLRQILEQLKALREEMRDESHSAKMFMDQLQARADRMRERGESQITAGDEPMEEWTSHVMNCAQLPDDAQGILRISLGSTPNRVDYVRFRGDRKKCVRLLQRAVLAMQMGDE